MSNSPEPPAWLQSRWKGTVSHGIFQGHFLAPLWGVKGILAMKGVISAPTSAAEPPLTGLEMRSDSLWSWSVAPGQAGWLCIPVTLHGLFLLICCDFSNIFGEQ